MLFDVLSVPSQPVTAVDSITTPLVLFKNPTAPEEQVELERLQLERSVYRRLLDLNGTEDTAVLDDVLVALLQIAGAERGFVQCRGLDGTDTVVASAMADDGVSGVLESISSGIVGETLARGEVVHTTSAMLDKRFNQFASVRRGAIQAVACAPIPPGLGVVYVQGPRPFDPDALAIVERIAVAFAPLIARQVVGRGETDPTKPWRDRFAARAIVGRSHALARVLQQAALFAPQPVPVLLTGPTGTGKSAIARAIHDNSPQSSGPFVPLNCATLPTELAESELFGAEAGAHSTATRKMEGKVGAAAGGTLFLDEIGELSPAVQAKLLELVQSGQYRELGSTRLRTSTARIVASDQCGFADCDCQRRVSPRSLPPPVGVHDRDAVSDGASYGHSGHCRRASGAGMREMSVPVLRLHRDAAVALAVRDWPGNVRELDNAIRRAAVFAWGEGSVEVAHSTFATASTPAIPLRLATATPPERSRSNCSPTPYRPSTAT